MLSEFSLISIGMDRETKQQLVLPILVIDAQCAAIEDVLQLIGDQSVSMRDPQQVTEKNVQEVEAILSMTDADLGQDSFSAHADSGTSARNPVRRS
jgi:hypothetical protein